MKINYKKLYFIPISLDDEEYDLFEAHIQLVKIDQDIKYLARTNKVIKERLLTLDDIKEVLEGKKILL